MVPGGFFYGSSWFQVGFSFFTLITPQNCILARLSSLGFAGHRPAFCLVLYEMLFLLPQKNLYLQKKGFLIQEVSPLVVLDRLCKVSHKPMTHRFVFETADPPVSQVNSCVHSNWSHLLQNLTFQCPSVKAVLPHSPTYAENDNQWRVVLFQWVAKLKPADSRRRLF